MVLIKQLNINGIILECLCFDFTVTFTSVFMILGLLVWAKIRKKIYSVPLLCSYVAADKCSTLNNIKIKRPNKNKCF